LPPAGRRHRARTGQSAGEVGTYDQELAQYRVALDSGADPAVVGQWIAEIQVRKLAAHARLRAATGARPGSERMTKEQIAATVTAISDLMQALRYATTKDKAEICAGLKAGARHSIFRRSGAGPCSPAWLTATRRSGSSAPFQALRRWAGLTLGGAGKRTTGSAIGLWVMACNLSATASVVVPERRREGDRVDGQSEAAFEEFVLGRQAALFRTAFLLTGDRGHAEDLLQGALERTYQHWQRVAAAGNPDAYVRRIVVNLANDRWRSRRHVVEQGLDAAAAASVRDCQAEQVESRDLVVRALRRVPVRMRTVLVLRYFEELSETETAAVMGCSVGTVKSQAARGLERLRAAISPEPGTAEINTRSAL
jgi:RNA polymerase sigma-70 factor (sigma-E family)